MTTAPRLPTLYFDEKRSLPLPMNSEELSANSSSTMSTMTTSADHTMLPAELAHRCLVEYSSWGDLAKLACVQTSWKSLVEDAANMSEEAKWDLAQSLLHGTNGLEANPQLAMKYLLELSNMKLDQETGRPVSQISETNNHLNKHNAAPFAPAMREIANCYLTGIGAEHDNTKGVAWLKASHTDGEDIDAAFQLAQIYEYGRHEVEIDVFAAFEWFKLGAEAGHADSMHELALCYELGCGVEQSDEEALEWYRKAAVLGHATAKYSVGEFHEEARGVPQSDEEACLWYYKAALDGDEDGREALRRLHDIARIVVPGVGRLLDG